MVWAFGKGARGRLGVPLRDNLWDRLVPMRVDPQHFGGAQVANPPLPAQTPRLFMAEVHPPALLASAPDALVWADAPPTP